MTLRTKSAPGPPPRPGLVWKDSTNRWVRRAATVAAKVGAVTDSVQKYAQKKRAAVDSKLFAASVQADHHLSKTKAGRAASATAQAGAAVGMAVGKKVVAGAKFLEHIATIPMRATQKLALQAAKERGESPEVLRIAAKVLKIADFVGGYVPGGIGMAAAGPWAGKIGSLMPSASLAYLGYGTAKNPRATIRAARKLIRGQADYLPDANAHHKAMGGSDTVEILLEALRQHPGDDWFLALLHAAIDATKGDIRQAVKRATDAFRQRKKAAWSLDASSLRVRIRLKAIQKGPGFTGIKKDARGREYYWLSGRRVKRDAYTAHVRQGGHVQAPTRRDERAHRVASRTVAQKAAFEAATQAMSAPAKITPEDLADLPKHLQTLNLKQLKQMRRMLFLQGGSRKKSDVVESVRAKLAAASKPKPEKPIDFDFDSPEQHEVITASHDWSTKLPDKIDGMPKSKKGRAALAKGVQAAMEEVRGQLAKQHGTRQINDLMTQEQSSAEHKLWKLLEPLETGRERDGPHDLGQMTDRRYAGYYKGALQALKEYRDSVANKPSEAKPRNRLAEERQRLPSREADRARMSASMAKLFNSSSGTPSPVPPAVGSPEWESRMADAAAREPSTPKRSPDYVGDHEREALAAAGDRADRMGQWAEAKPASMAAQGHAAAALARLRELRRLMGAS